MQLILVTGIIATIVASAVIYKLYLIKLDAQREELQNVLRDQAELLEFLAENGSEDVRRIFTEFTSDESILKQNENPQEALMLQNHLALDVYGKSGRFIGGKLIEERIVFFRIGGDPTSAIPEPAPLQSNATSPMREALVSKKSGIYEFMGFEGEQVVVAAQPIESLDIAIVARFNLSEIRAPYIRYGVLTLLVALASIIGSWLIYRKYGVAYIDYLVDDLSAHKEDAKVSRKELVDVKSKHAKTEAKLEESENKYKSIFESSEDPMWLMLDGKFIHSNKAALKTFNAESIDDFINTHPSMFSPLQQPDGTNSYLAAEDRMGQAIKNGYARFIWIHKRLNGEEFPAEVTLTRINVNGRVGIHAMVRDITEKKMIEDNLQEALKEAERANVAKSEFLASMSHEFRTPLNAILGFSQMLKAQYFGPLGSDKYYEYVNDIHSSGAHLLDLINDILDISAIEAGANPLEKSYFNLYELVEECVAIVDPATEKNDIKILTNIEKGIQQIYGHRRGIKQILVNILANAVKYNHVGGEVLLKSHVKNDVLTIMIKDTGIGIDEDFLPRILEPFSRAEEDSHMAQEGTGLGLSICQKLIESYNGSMNIESTYGIGTTVTVIIPVQSENLMRDVG